MRQSIVVSVFLLGLLAGCTSRDVGPPQAQITSGADETIASAHGHSAVAGMRARTAGIAALPDRGQLLAIRRDAAPRRSLAYTWRPVDISEAHALHAIGGEMTVTAPDGHAIRLQYERHIEHADGNWTWVGRQAGAAPGTEAILTFGEKAVFGTIPVGEGSPLRITTGGGRTWMMETDDGAVAALPAANPRGTDALLPPVRGSRSVGASRHAASLGAQEATSASPTVDLLIGYTSGFATRLGGQSQANTRLVNLVDITNQAYANSQIAGRVRLVKTMQVNYPDATANSAALYALTGCTETACTQVDPALQPLHVAREQYGADAISLVRNFNDPENGGCGIAWLIGGGQTPIASADEYAAMSVVSDTNGMGGAGSFPDNGFVCRDETLGHELGHNMGSAHDVATADGDDGLLQAEEYGRYAYSFGYKTMVETGNFFTVMAYGDSGQTRYRVFSNPRITYCGGYACGTADADNSKTLDQTMLVIASFRASILGGLTVHDVDGDGKSDFLLRNQALASGNFGYWLMDGATATTRSSTTMATSYRVATTGDFNGDGKVDIVWTSNNRDVRIWFGNGWGFGATPSTPNTFPSISGSYPAGWAIAGATDIDGDGKSDLVFRTHTTSTNNLMYWVMNGAGVSRTGTVSMAASYRIGGLGDFNGDGRGDILWTSNSRDVRVWLGTGTSFGATTTTPGSFPALVGSYPSGWSVAGVGDVDGDGKSDVLLRTATTSTSNVSYWLMNGVSRIRIGWATMAASYEIAAIGDYNGDSKLDIAWTSVWRDLRVWLGNGTGFGATVSTPGTFPALAGTYASGWTIVK